MDKSGEKKKKDNVISIRGLDAFGNPILSNLPHPDQIPDDKKEGDVKPEEIQNHDV
ncbi:MAG: hypothetical protein V1746_07025 [bacterium]